MKIREKVVKELVFAVYIQKPDHKFPKVRLTDEEYGKAIARFARTCSDVVLVDSEIPVIYLTRRKLGHPSGWWWLGGAPGIGVLEEEAARQNLKRETSLDLSLERFRLMRRNAYLWAERDYEPRDLGSDDRVYTYVVEASKKEIKIASAHLDKEEYEEGVGLQPFDRTKILQASGFDETAREAVLDLYDQLFPPS